MSRLVVFEHLAVEFVAGVAAFDFGPEGGTVIKMTSVAQFVNQHIVAELIGQAHQADVQRYHAF